MSAPPDVCCARNGSWSRNAPSALKLSICAIFDFPFFKLEDSNQDPQLNSLLLSKPNRSWRGIQIFGWGSPAPGLVLMGTIPFSSLAGVSWRARGGEWDHVCKVSWTCWSEKLMIPGPVSAIICLQFLILIQGPVWVYLAELVSSRVKELSPLFSSSGFSDGDKSPYCHGNGSCGKLNPEMWAEVGSLYGGDSHPLEALPPSRLCSLKPGFKGPKLETLGSCGTFFIRHEE